MAASNQRVVVALSGGVDSSVAAALLKEAGFEVIGVTLQLVTCQEGERQEAICGFRAAALAHEVASHLGIPHHLLDCRQEFEEQVLKPSWEEYDCGRTPNPCVLCNQRIKFGRLLPFAASLGASKVATGHYARVEGGQNGQVPQLLRGRDPHKDQSYFLHTLDATQLGSVLFPVGTLSKREVRSIANRMSLPSAEAPESQDACFMTDPEGFAETLRQRFGQPARPGEIVDPSGKVLGRHPGIHLFTIGQRRALGVALGRPAFVRTIDAASARLVVTTQDGELLSRGLLATQVRWGPRFTGFTRGRCLVQIRYRHQPEEAMMVRRPDGTVSVEFNRPVRAVTPGQAAVFYQGEAVVGGGWIIEAHRLPAGA